VHLLCLSCTVRGLHERGAAEDVPKTLRCPCQHSDGTACSNTVDSKWYFRLEAELLTLFPPTKQAMADDAAFMGRGGTAYVTLLTGQMYPITFQPLMTVQDFCAEVAVVTGVEPNKQQLMYSGTRLTTCVMDAATGRPATNPETGAQIEATMGDFNVEHDASILLVKLMVSGIAEAVFNLEWGFPKGKDFDFLDSSCLLFDRSLGSPTVVDYDHKQARGAVHSGDQFKGMGSGGGGSGGGGNTGNDEMSKLLRAAGAKTGALTCSLMWHNTDDLDLHCNTPNGSHIYHGNKQSAGGELDVDMNASSLVTNAVENIYFRDSPQAGRYKFWVKNYKSRNDGPTPFTIRMMKGGKTEDKEFVWHDDDVTVFEFDWQGEMPDESERPERGAHAMTIKFRELSPSIHFGFIVLSEFGLGCQQGLGGAGRGMVKFRAPTVALKDESGLRLCEDFSVKNAGSSEAIVMCGFRRDPSSEGLFDVVPLGDSIPGGAAMCAGNSKNYGPIEQQCRKLAREYVMIDEG
jgi:hypothetical protein